MVTENADMALDDFISKNKIKIGKGGRGGGAGKPRGGGRGGDRRSGGRNTARDRGGDRGAVSKRGGSGFNNRRNRNLPDRWEHDMFAGGRRGRDGNTGGSAGNKLIVNNLDFGVTDADMEELFSEFGTLRKASILYDRSGRSTGSAEVEFVRASDARQAREQYHQVPLDGRAMNITIMGNRESDRDFEDLRGDRRRNNRDRSPRRERSRPGGNRRGGRGGGPRGGRPQKEKKEPVTQEQLDAEMEEYLKERSK